MADIAIHVQPENAERQAVHAPSDMNTKEFIDQLLEGLDLPRKNGNGHHLYYRLEDRQTGRVLDPVRTLEENGVRVGDTLFLRMQANTIPCPHCQTENALASKFCRRCGKSLEPSHPRVGDLRVHVHFEDGTSRSVEAPGDLKTGELIAGIASAKEGASATWTLYDKDSGQNLDPDKTLIENGVASGHHLYLRRDLEPPIPLWKILAGVAVLAVITGCGILLYIHFSNRIALTPTTASLSVSEPQQFTVTGHPQRVRWTLSPPLGTITQEGLYTAPRVIQSPQSVTVGAISLEHSGKSATAKVALRPPVQVTVVVDPETATLSGGETVRFGAIVSGSSNTDVRWSLEQVIGSISEQGVYRAPSLVSSETSVNVIATSEADRTSSGTAKVTLKPITISLHPERGTARAAESVRFNAVISGTPNHGVRWSTTGPGYLSKNGVYFAPPTISEPQVVTILAASSADPTKTAAALVRLVPVVSVTVQPVLATVSPGQHVHFTAAVTGTMNPNLRWLLSGPGTLSQNGDYIAPTSIPTEQNVSVTITSEADPSKSVTAMVTLKPISVSLLPASVELWASQSRRFSATVQGTPMQAVRWSLSGRGTLSQDGVFVAPSSIPVDQVTRVTATSVLDPSRSATALVMLKPYSGPMTGMFTWSGQIEKNGTVTIDDAGASRGQVLGNMLPGLPVQISLDNNNEFALERAPGPSNGWKRLTIRSRRGKRSNVRITWLVVTQ